MKGKRDKPFGLDLPFDEALTRYLGTSMAETREVERIEREKKRRPEPPQVCGESSETPPTLD